MMQRDIQGHLLDMYGVEVSAELISTVTDSVMEGVAAWRNRPAYSRRTRAVIPTEAGH